MDIAIILSECYNVIVILLFCVEWGLIDAESNLPVSIATRVSVYSGTSSLSNGRRSDMSPVLAFMRNRSVSPSLRKYLTWSLYGGVSASYALTFLWIHKILTLIHLSKFTFNSHVRDEILNHSYIIKI